MIVIAEVEVTVKVQIRKALPSDYERGDGIEPELRESHDEAMRLLTKAGASIEPRGLVTKAEVVSYAVL